MTTWRQRATGNTADFSGYDSIYDARVDREKKEKAGWASYNVAVSDLEKKAALSEVKETERAWLNYLLSAQSIIKDDEPKFENVERAMFILSGIKDRPTGQQYRGLWSSVNRYQKGRQYNGKTFGAMEFKSMTHYNSFLVGLAMNFDYCGPILKAEGVEL